MPRDIVEHAQPSSESQKPLQAVVSKQKEPAQQTELITETPERMAIRADIEGAKTVASKV